MFLLHAHHEGGSSPWSVLGETLLEFLPVLLVLFLTYLLMEWMEHKMGERTRLLLARAGGFAPVLGGAVGIIPQCGFSAAAAGLYAGRVVSVGTLFAVFLATSDEMLPIVLSNAVHGDFAPWSVLRILGGKLLIGILVGVLIDLVFHLVTHLRAHRAPHHEGEAEHHDHDHDHAHDEEEHHGHIHEMCRHAGCGCEGGIFRSALKHTVEIGLFILLVSLALNFAVYFIGHERIAAFLDGSGGWVYLLSSLVGLVPNCAASVVVTELYIGGALTTGGLYAGLLSGAGVGTLVLCRVNRPWWANLAIIAGLWALGAALGATIDLLSLSWLGLKFY